MSMHFEELDSKTREYMLQAFDAEQNGGQPFLSERLSAKGAKAFPDLMRAAIISGNEISLLDSLLDTSLWVEYVPYTTPKGAPSTRRLSVPNAAEGLALTEFNTWYVRGLAKRLMDEGETQCQIYRAQEARSGRASCSHLEGEIVSLDAVYRGHRAQYWPKPGNHQAFSVPAHTFCHHTIRRIAKIS